MQELCFTYISFIYTSVSSSVTQRSLNSGLQVRRRRGKMRMAAEGAQKLLEACKTIVKDQGKLVYEIRCSFKICISFLFVSIDLFFFLL